MSETLNNPKWAMVKKVFDKFVFAQTQEGASVAIFRTLVPLAGPGDVIQFFPKKYVGMGRWNNNPIDFFANKPLIIAKSLSEHIHARRGSHEDISFSEAFPDPDNTQKGSV